MSIALRDLTKRYGPLVVVDHVELEVPDGELFVLLGASGSGKSTVLRMIAGLTQPDSGRVLLGGLDVTGLPPQKRGTGYVFQNYSIFRPMTVARNIEFGLMIRKVPGADRRRRREELLDLVELAGLGDRYPDQLSGGQQQRVALARALAYEPSVLLLDEPFGALDVKIRGQLRRSLHDIQERLGVTTILVTHDQEEAFELADRVGVIERGRLLECGRPADLYERPRSYFVATFLGTSNVLVGKERAGHGHFGPHVLPIPEDSPHEPGVRVQLMFRPEHVVLSAGPSPAHGGAGMLHLGQGRVLEQRFSGASVRLRLRLPRLAFTRQISPYVPFGEEGFVVEALLPSGRALPSVEPWVSVPRWQILEQPPWSLLVLDSPDGPNGPLATARLLEDGMGAAVTVLGLGRNPEEAEPLRRELKERMDRFGLGRGELLLRFGRPDQEASRRLGEEIHDIVVTAAGERWRPAPDRRNETVLRLLERAEAPILVVSDEPRPVRSMLITTALGEPGKSTVRFGGRIARRLGASATVFHAPSTGDDARTGVMARYLDRAVGYLRGLEVPGEVRVRPSEAPARAVLEEARAGGHDLIVVGAHGPRDRSILGLDDVTVQVVSGADRPVLVVPAEEA